MLLCCIQLSATAQRKYATAPASGASRAESAVSVLTIGSETWYPTTDAGIAAVTNAGNATNATKTDYATLKSRSLEVLFVATHVGRSSLSFDFSADYPNGIPANQKSYLQIDAPTKAGVNIQLLELLGLINKNVFVEYSNNNTSWTKLEGVKLVTNKLNDTEVGKYYLEAAPAESYKYLRVTVQMELGLLNISLGGGIDLNVYNAFTEPFDGTDCGYAWATDEGNFSGLTVNVGSLLQTLGLTYNSFVNTPGLATDGDINTASTLTSGLLGVNVGTISQTLLFKGTNESSNDEVKVTLGFAASLLKLSLFNGISLQAYNGNVAVGESKRLSDLLLNLDLLGLFSNNRKYPVSFKPGAPFDRVTISSANLLDVELAEVGLQIYEAERTLPKPTANNSQEYIFTGTQPTTTATATRASGKLTWFGTIENNIPVLGSSTTSPYRFPVTLTQSGIYMVAEENNASCPNYSGYTNVNIIVLEDQSLPIPAGISTNSLIAGGQIIITGSGTHNFTYSASTLPQGVDFNTTTGAFTASTSTLANVSIPTTFPITITILDNGLPTGLSINKNLLINPLLVFTGGTFPESKVAAGPFSVNVANLSGVSTIGGNGNPITYSLTNPALRSLAALPTGFTLSPEGTLSGSPDLGNLGDYEFDIFATDGEQVSSAPFSLKISNAPLPVKLANFAAQQVQQKSVLTWKTTEESNSASFDIENSTDGKKWSLVGTISASGETKTPTDYSFDHNNPNNGLNYYRLKMNDLDGTYANSRILKLFIETKNIVYPNPATQGDYIQLDITDFTAVALIKINNAFGKTVYQSTQIPSEGIQANILSPGLYIIQVLQKDGSMNSYKLLKQ